VHLSVVFVVVVVVVVVVKFYWLVLNAPPVPKWLFSAPYFR